ncbi:hypothetical protein BC827DRAFT_1097694, partial [Russula dissimulans]
FQDKRDKSSTVNLKQHAICCFGVEAVNAALKGEKFTPSGNIFTAFAHWGQQLVTCSHQAHTIPEMRHPNLKVPSPNTVWCNVKAAYVKCHERIAKLLQDHPGCIHIATDVWTS